MNAAKERLVARRVSCAQHLGDHGFIGFDANEAACQQRLDFRPEQELIPGPAPVERLDAETIPHEVQALPARIPYREREHAAQPVRAADPPLFVGVNDRLGVRSRPVLVTQALELGPEIAVVVDFAVEDRPDRAVFVRQRLPAAFQVDDAQPPVDQDGSTIRVHAGIVRTAMGRDVPHLKRAPGRAVVQPIWGHNSRNSAHERCRSSSKRGAISQSAVPECPTRVQLERRLTKVC